MGRAPWKELGGEWDPTVDGAGAVKMMHPWLFSLLSTYPERLELPVCLGRPKTAPSPAGRCWQQERTLVLKLCLLGEPFPLGEWGRDEGDPRNML